MNIFCNDNILLQSPAAQRLYHDFASTLPIVDYHCHIDAKDIAEDIRFDNIAQIWLRGDHYKWRLMRSAGVDERLITGDASDREKFDAWVNTVSYAAGHPLYHWSHLELLRYFGFTGDITPSNADAIWDISSNMLSKSNMSARGLILQSNVERLCTTDDPADALESHTAILSDTDFKVGVHPTFRPDPAVDIEKSSFPEYIQRLSKAADIEILTLKDMKDALLSRMEYFANRGCVLADHGTERIAFRPTTVDRVAQLFEKRMSTSGCALSLEDIESYKTEMMMFCAEAYHMKGWTMQLHFGCRRDNNTSALRALGPNTGYDTIADGNHIEPLARYLDALQSQNTMPRMILYSLNPNDNAALDTLAGCFREGDGASYISHGAAWWFNDHEQGMRDHLLSLSSQSYLPAFMGMLTDSRSLLSYSRHEYFRRIFCDVLGGWVDDGRMTSDLVILKDIVARVCYRNSASLFASKN